MDDEKGKTFHLIDLKYMAHRVKIQADAQKIRSSFTMEILNTIKPDLEGCVP